MQTFTHIYIVIFNLYSVVGKDITNRKDDMEDTTTINAEKGDSPSIGKLVTANVGDTVKISESTLNCPLDLTASRWATVEQLLEVTPGTITILACDPDKQEETREGYVAPPSSPIDSAVGAIRQLDSEELESAMEEAQPPLFTGRDTTVTVPNKEEKAEDENLSEAKPKVGNNTQKVKAMDSKEQEKMDPKNKVRVNAEKGHDTEDSTPSSPGHRSKTSGSNRAEDQGDLGNLIPVVLDDQKEKKKREIQANADIKPAFKKDFDNSEEVCHAIAMEIIEAVIKTKTNNKSGDEEEKVEDAQDKVKAAEEESVNCDPIYKNSWSIIFYQNWYLYHQ